MRKIYTFAGTKVRGVAQLASVLAWGASGRPFESDHPDIKKQPAESAGCFFMSIPANQ